MSPAATWAAWGWLRISEAIVEQMIAQIEDSVAELPLDVRVNQVAVVA